MSIDFPDRYNTLEGTQPRYLFEKIVNAKIEIAPTSDETLEKYLFRLKIYQDIAAKKEWAMHVDNPYKTWHCHKNPMGCVICDQTKFIGVTIQVLEYIQAHYSDIQFKQT